MLITSQMSAYGALLGNSFLDIKKSAKHISDLYSSLYRSIPYMNGLSNGNFEMSDRKAFIKQYWDMHKQNTKQPAPKTGE